MWLNNSAENKAKAEKWQLKRFHFSANFLDKCRLQKFLQRESFSFISKVKPCPCTCKCKGGAALHRQEELRWKSRHNVWKEKLGFTMLSKCFTKLTSPNRILSKIIRLFMINWKYIQIWNVYHIWLTNLQRLQNSKFCYNLVSSVSQNPRPL